MSLLLFLVSIFNFQRRDLNSSNSCEINGGFFSNLELILMQKKGSLES